MIESPPTVSPQRETCTSASNLSTHCTNLAVARACRPLRLTIGQVRTISPSMASRSVRAVRTILGHLPANTRLAMLMYFRPASCAWVTA